MKLFFSDEGARSQKITLIEENEIIDSDKEISLIFDKYFSSFVCSLNVSLYKDLLINFENIGDPFDLLREKYKYYSSTLATLGEQFEKI